MRICELSTPFEKDGCDWTEYPRPQMKRDSYLSLCGKWELSVMKKCESTKLGKITVPYPPESRISGINRKTSKKESYSYYKKFTLPENFNKGRILLHFGAVDQFAIVYLNERVIGAHNGGYLPFTFEITDLVKDGENLLEVETVDKLDTDYPYGKQRYKRGGMWYTPISGIWQAVWLESVPESYIRDIRMDVCLDKVTIEVSGGEEEKTVLIHTEKVDIARSFKGKSCEIEIPEPKLWTPEEPYLYSFTLSSGEDRVESYFALRTIDTEQIGDRSYICLNGKPYFFHGVLDQGYFSDGIYTPASPKGYEYDILTMKKLGFNMLRKHIKIEPELFYYYCDKYGMIVFQDMVNSGKYNFLIDTALPTIGLRKGIKHKASKRRRALFERMAEETVKLLYNHPSVCYYTIFNEGWGQYDADRIYLNLKNLDATRIWDATSGWFKERFSDVDSEHIYFKKTELTARAGRPLVLSEFGGYSCKIEGHIFNLDKNYGYKTFASEKELCEGIKTLYMDEIIPAIKNGLCACVLTQLSDVEDETNGLVTYDRQVIKTDEKLMQEISSELHKAFEEAIIR